MNKEVIAPNLQETSLVAMRLVHNSMQAAKCKVSDFVQGGHGTGKIGNLAVNFSRQGKHREFSKFNFLHRENCANTGKILKI